MADRQGGSGGVLRLRNLAMIENIRRAQDPAWRERLEQQQVLARLGRMFGRAEDPLQSLQDHADALARSLVAEEPSLLQWLMLTVHLWCCRRLAAVDAEKQVGATQTWC